MSEIGLEELPFVDIQQICWLLLVSEPLQKGDTNMPLKDVTVRKAKPSAKPRKLSDGGGLHVLIQPNRGDVRQPSCSARMRRAADRGEYRQAAGAIAQGLSQIVRRRVFAPVDL
jgi:hypothetical protein